VALKQGDIVTVKTTGEYVYFTGKQFDNGTWEVHRPVLTRDGIKHEYSAFESAELETVEEHLEREVKEAYAKLDAQQKLMSARNKALAVEPDGPKEYFN
jgi:hypothetical protein